MVDEVSDFCGGDLTGEEVRLVVEQVTALQEQFSGAVEIMQSMVASGIMGWRTWATLLEYIESVGLRLAQYSNEASHPGLRPCVEVDAGPRSELDTEVTSNLFPEVFSISVRMLLSGEKTDLVGRFRVRESEGRLCE